MLTCDQCLHKIEEDNEQIRLQNARSGIRIYRCILNPPSFLVIPGPQGVQVSTAYPMVTSQTHACAKISSVMNQ